MKTIKVLKKSVIALFLAFAVMSFTACDLLGGGSQQPDGKTYTVTLENTVGATLAAELTEYVSGTEAELPLATKTNYDFGGWYTGDNRTGDRVYKIPSNSKGDVTYYAYWIPNAYGIQYVIDGKSYEGTPAVYKYNVPATLPVPEKDDYVFDGWYTQSNMSGEKVSAIAAGETGSKKFYGRWIAGVKSSAVNLVYDTGVTLSFQLTQYIEGESATLPEASKGSEYRFDGWFDNQQCNGTAVKAIPATATGAQTFWAKFTKITADTVVVSGFGGYQEGAYIEFNKPSASSATYSVYYKKDTASASYGAAIDTQLIREDGDKVRADIVGLSAGNYVIKVDAGSGNYVEKSVKVEAYDRSGYAHFKADGVGVGGYNDDGTPKSNAYIIYANESTKNSVTAPWNSKIKGLARVLADLGNANKPVIIRIVGRISAATWKQIKYTKGSGDLDAAQVIAQTKTKTGVTLEKKSYTQDELIKLKVNSLDESKVTELEGMELTSKMKYSAADSSHCERFDSCWNDCVIKNANNVTVEGIGADAELYQWGMTWKADHTDGKTNSSNIEVRNLTFRNYTEDACSFEGTNDSKNSTDGFDFMRIWLHNNTFYIGVNYWDVCEEQDKGDGDGSTDFKKLSYVTIAYNHYIKTHKTGLIGGGDSQTTANVTFHHNFYDQCQSRLPLARQANMHMYNNYYYKSSGQNMSIRAGGYALIENCYFDNAKDCIVTANGDSKMGAAKVYNCEFVGISPSDANVKVVSKRTDTVTNHNIYDTSFDTNSSMFYYDSSNKVTLVTRMDGKANVPQVCKDLSGALHSGRYTKN